MTQQFSQAQQAQQTNRTADGKYTIKTHSEAPDIDLGLHHDVPGSRFELEASSLGPQVDAAWLVDRDGQQSVHATVQHNFHHAVPTAYAAQHRHTDEDIDQYLMQRQRVIENAVGQWHGGEAKAVGHGDDPNSWRMEMSQELDDEVTDEQALDILHEELEPYSVEHRHDLNAHIAAALEHHDAQKLANPSTVDETSQRQFTDHFIATMKDDLQYDLDDQTDDDVEVSLTPEDESKLRGVIDEFYANNAGDLQAWQQATAHNPGGEAYLSTAGHAQDVEHASTALDNRVIGRRLERSFGAEMPKLDTASGQVELDDDGTVHIHSWVFGQT